MKNSSIGFFIDAHLLYTVVLDFSTGNKGDKGNQLDYFEDANIKVLLIIIVFVVYVCQF